MEGISIATCDPGFKVASCGFHSSGNANMNIHVSSYTTDGHTCVCDTRDENISQCQAVCVPEEDLRDYHIEQKAGKGIITVECRKNMQLLGCGYKSSAIGPTDEYWFAGPASSHSCVCKNTNGATCYSICAVVRPSS